MGRTKMTKCRTYRNWRKFWNWRLKPRSEINSRRVVFAVAQASGVSHDVSDHRAERELLSDILAESNTERRTFDHWIQRDARLESDVDDFLAIFPTQLVEHLCVLCNRRKRQYILWYISPENPYKKSTRSFSRKIDLICSWSIFLRI